MKQIAKLKDEARKYEQREEWDRAIQAYGEVLRLGEAGDGAELDLPLYNRVGDLYVRLGRAAEAVKYYEQAADKYAEAGLYNNAIALCNKALRYDAGRVELLKKLGQFSASQGFFTDARRWYLEYCERMSKRGAIDQAFQALSELADVHDDPEIRELLARQLKDHDHPEQAINEYRRAYAARVARGETREADAIRAEIHALDPNASLDVEPQESGAYQSSIYDELPGFDDPAAPTAPPVAIDGPVEPTTFQPETIEIESAATSFDATPAGNDFGAIELEQPVTSPAPDTLDDLLPFDIGIEPSLEFKPPVEEPAETVDTDATPPFDMSAVSADDLLQLPEIETGEPALAADDLELSLPTFEEEEAVEAAEEDLAPLPGWDEEGAEQVDDDEPLPLMEGEREAPADELAIADLHLSTSDGEVPSFTPHPIFEIEQAEEVTAELPAETFEAVPELEPEPEPEPEPELEVEPDFEPEPNFEPEPVFVADTIAPEPMLEPQPEPEPEPEPIPERGEPVPPPARAPVTAAATKPKHDYVDLGAFLLDEPEPEETTRFVVAERAPTGDEERDFADMLQQFKAKVAETIPKEDAGSHYDLGLAFKEMGLIDEAIAEFQTALRGGEEKLKVYEELGNCFVQKRQYSVAITILTRAMQMPHADEGELLGVYYNLGRAHEELGQHTEARSAYERVIAVDIGFQDTSERLAKL